MYSLFVCGTWDPSAVDAERCHLVVKEMLDLIAKVGAVCGEEPGDIIPSLAVSLALNYMVGSHGNPEYSQMRMSDAARAFNVGAEKIGYRMTIEKVEVKADAN